MDPTTLNTAVGIIGIIVGIIGIVTAAIGKKELHEATKIRNMAKADNGSIIYQANTITQGVNENTVRLITKDMTKEQLCRLIIKLIPINTDDDNCIAKRLHDGDITSDMYEQLINEIPPMFYGSKEPPESIPAKGGSIWISQ